MARLIDADKINYHEHTECMGHGDFETVRTVTDREIAEIPTADVAPVRHGRWENGNPICPVCGGDKFKDLDADIWCDWKPAFCPNCGAKMDLEEG